MIFMQIKRFFVVVVVFSPFPVAAGISVWAAMFC